MELLIEACDKNDILKVIELFEKGYDTNIINSKYAILCSMIMRNQFEISKILIKHGINVNLKGFDGYTPLMLESQLGNTELVELLIEYGAKINAKNAYDFTPLSFAVLFRKFEIVELLINKGADINIANGQDENALALLLNVNSYNYKIAEILIKNGINCHFESIFKQTPLKMAINRNYKDIVTLMIQYDVDINSESFNSMLKKGWNDLCLKVTQKKAFDRRKHLLESYYSYTY